MYKALETIVVYANIIFIFAYTERSFWVNAEMFHTMNADVA